MPAAALAGVLVAACSGSIQGEDTPGSAGRPGTGGTAPPGERPPPRDDTPELRGARCDALTSRVWKLTPTQFSRSIEALIPSAKNVGEGLDATLSRTGQFTNYAADLQMSAPHVSDLLERTQKAAEMAVASLPAARACVSGDAADETCVGQFLEAFIPRAFRTEVPREEVERFSAYFKAQREKDSGRDALVQTVRAVLVSPNFLYRTELGGSGSSLSSYEKAAALSYFLTDAPPDDALWEAARSGALDAAGEMERQAKRLLTTESASGLMNFWREFIGYERVATLDAVRTKYPNFPELRGELVAETDAFLREAIWRQKGNLETLYGANFSVLNGKLAQLYGVDSSASEFEKVTFSESQPRFGLLTQGSVLAQLAHDETSDVIKRGVWVREHLLCETLPPVPAVVPEIPPRAGGTQRAQLEAHRKDPVCQECHQFIDPLGYAFENYDEVGRYRTHEAGQRVDASGFVVDIENPDNRHEFEDLAGLANYLGTSQHAFQCFANSLRAYALGQNPCTDVEVATLPTSTSVLDLAVRIVSSESFVKR